MLPRDLTWDIHAAKECERENTLIHCLSKSRLGLEDQPPPKNFKNIGGTIDDVDVAMDPLSDPSVFVKDIRDDSSFANDNFDLIKWKSMKDSIVKMYSRKSALKVSRDLLNNFNAINVGGVNTSGALAKAGMRLAHLNSKTTETASNNISHITQKEYLDRVAYLQDNLKRAWSKNDRVQSLKIAIQAGKLLGDCVEIEFYPMLWAKLTDIMETFGELVLARIMELSRTQEPHSQALDPVETCKNWFFKISCVHDLVARLYLETAILKCYKYLPNTDYLVVLKRLSSISRGIGNPIVSLYYRVFLFHAETAISDFASRNLSYRASSFVDFMTIANDFRARKLKFSPHENSEVSQSELFDSLCEPGLHWLLSRIGANATKEEFQDFMKRYGSAKSSSSHQMLGLILQHFPAMYYSNNSLEIAKQILKMDITENRKSQLFAKLGEGLLLSPPPLAQRLPLLNEVWRIVSEIEDLVIYSECTAAYVELALRYYTEKEVGSLLKHLVLKLDSLLDPHDDMPQTLSTQLERICRTLCLDSHNDFGVILTNRYLMKLLDKLQSSKKTALLKSSLELYLKNAKRLRDPLIMHAIFEIFRDLHQTIDSMTIDDEKRQITGIICKYIEKMDYGRDFENHLNMLIECRAEFYNLDPVKDLLVVTVADLAMRTLRYIKGRHTKRTTTFVKSCIAYCHITIPSIDNVLKRMTLYRLVAQSALMNHLLPQADALLTLVVGSIRDIPESIETDVVGTNVNHVMRKYVHSESLLVDFLVSFVGGLLPVPGHPAKGPFWIVEHLLEELDSYQYWTEHGYGKLRVRIQVMKLLGNYRQPKFVSHIPGVSSNDTLFGGSLLYCAALEKLAASLYDQIVEDIKNLPVVDKSHSKKQSNEFQQWKQQQMLQLDFVNVLLVFYDSRKSNIRNTIKELLRKTELQIQSAHENWKSKKPYVAVIKFHQHTDSYYQKILDGL